MLSLYPVRDIGGRYQKEGTVTLESSCGPTNLQSIKTERA